MDAYRLGTDTDKLPRPHKPIERTPTHALRWRCSAAWAQYMTTVARLGEKDASCVALLDEVSSCALSLRAAILREPDR